MGRREADTDTGERRADGREADDIVAPGDVRVGRTFVLYFAFRCRILASW